MSVYFIAQIKIEDMVEYQKYLDGCDEIFAHYSGQYLAVDEHPLLLEGAWPYTKTVLIQFPSEEMFRRWYESTEYQDLLKHRLQAARCNTVVIKGQ